MSVTHAATLSGLFHALYVNDWRPPPVAGSSGSAGSLSGMEPTPCYRHPQEMTRISCQRCNRPICHNCMVSGSVGFQCPECVHTAARRTRQNVLPYGGKRSSNPAITSIVLIALNALVFVATSIMGGANSRLFDVLALLPQGQCRVDETRFLLSAPSECAASGYQWVDGVATGAWWQVVTSAFVHANAMHIGFNMLALWFLGPQLERIFGRLRFLALYFVSALAASALVMAASTPFFSTVGASGAIFGLMGGILLVALKHKGDVRTILMWLAVNVVITVLGSGFISWQGHLGGFIGGVLVAAAVMYVPKKFRPVGQWVAIGAIAAVALAVIVARAFALAA